MICGNDSQKLRVDELEFVLLLKKEKKRKKRGMESVSTF